MSGSFFSGLERKHIIGAFKEIDSGVPNNFSESTRYDVLYEGKRYSPKAVIGVALKIKEGVDFNPYDFKGGIGSQCFNELEKHGFSIVNKGDDSLYPDEVREGGHEGAMEKVTVNKFERDPKARKKCIKHYGLSCQVCGFNFKELYGELGEGFIHVHHLVPLSYIRESYKVDPIKDLRPVCANCHAMLHKRNPPFEIQELKEIINKVGA